MFRYGGGTPFWVRESSTCGFRPPSMTLLRFGLYRMDKGEQGPCEPESRIRSVPTRSDRTAHPLRKTGKIL
jgi:hypothetical protein